MYRGYGNDANGWELLWDVQPIIETGECTYHQRLSYHRFAR